MDDCTDDFSHLFPLFNTVLISSSSFTSYVGSDFLNSLLFISFLWLIHNIATRKMKNDHILASYRMIYEDEVYGLWLRQMYCLLNLW